MWRGEFAPAPGLATRKAASNKEEFQKMPYMYTHSSLAFRILKNIDTVKRIRVHGRHDPAGILTRILESALPDPMNGLIFGLLKSKL